MGYRIHMLPPASQSFSLVLAQWHYHPDSPQIPELLSLGLLHDSGMVSSVVLQHQFLPYESTQVLAGSSCPWIFFDKDLARG